MAWPVGYYEAGSPRLTVFAAYGIANFYVAGVDVDLDVWRTDETGAYDNSAIAIPIAMSPLSITAALDDYIRGSNKIICGQTPTEKVVLNIAGSTNNGIVLANFSGPSRGLMDVLINFSSDYAGADTVSVIKRDVNTIPLVGVIFGDVTAASATGFVVGVGGNIDGAVALDLAIGEGTWIGGSFKAGIGGLGGNPSYIFNSIINNAGLDAGILQVCVAFDENNFELTNSIVQSAATYNVAALTLGDMQFHNVASRPNAAIGEDIPTAADGYTLVSADAQGVDMTSAIPLSYTSDIFDVLFDTGAWDRGARRFIGGSTTPSIEDITPINGSTVNDPALSVGCFASWPVKTFVAYFYNADGGAEIGHSDQVTGSGTISLPWNLVISGTYGFYIRLRSLSGEWSDPSSTSTFTFNYALYSGTTPEEGDVVHDTCTLTSGVQWANNGFVAVAFDGSNDEEIGRTDGISGSGIAEVEWVLEETQECTFYFKLWNNNIWSAPSDVVSFIFVKGYEWDLHPVTVVDVTLHRVVVTTV